MNDPLITSEGFLFQRVVVVGANGAGKTWLAGRFGLPVISKDALALTSGWRQRPRTQVQAALVDAIAAPAWVLEGGPSVLIPSILARAQVVIWLDMPAGVRFWRIVRRSVRYMGRVRPEHPPGNRDWPGRRQARFAWCALRHGPRFEAAIAVALDGVDMPVTRLRSRAEVDRFLKEL